jgi:transposase InsO family protein
MTETGVQVWALPVLLLPSRFLLGVGLAIGSFSGEDLRQTVETAVSRLPENIRGRLLAHSDRGSQMKSKKTKSRIEELLSIPIHFGRPRVKDDHAWIESLNKTMKYHRKCPERFYQVADIRNWLDSFPEIYNNDPHSTLKYVTPTEVVLGEADNILAQRKENLRQAKEKRRQAYWKAKKT